MNGEMMQAAADVAVIEYCRKTGKILTEQKENPPERVFHFLDGRETDEYEKWIKWVNDDGIRKMILYPNMPKILERRKQLGFLGAFVVIQPVFHANGSMTFWQNRFEFQKEEKRWKIDAVEREWKNGPTELITFPGKPETGPFLQALRNGAAFCDKIEVPDWKKVFERSIAMLTIPDYDFAGSNVHKYFALYEKILPHENLRLLAASASAFVFGAMGSWNDGPAGKAEAMGCKEEYDKVSEEILFGCVANLTYAVNHSQA